MLRRMLQTFGSLLIVAIVLFQFTSCQQAEVTSIMVKSITVTQFPSLKNGNNWDILDGPDMYPAIYRDSTLLYKETTNHENADASQNHAFLDVNVELTDLEATYEIRLYDADSFGGDELMGKVNFTLTTDDSDKTLSFSNSEVAMELRMEWFRD